MTHDQPNQEYDEHGDWISLQEACERLGVSTATLRRWGDAGKATMKRTLGGHRRFLAAEIEQLARSMAPATSVVPVAEAHPRMGMVDPQELRRQQWHTRLATRATSDRLRGLGQRLLGVLIQFINRQADDQRFLEEAGAIGAHYGQEARIAGISMHDTLEAFLFFRSSFSQLAMPLPGIAQPTDLAEAARLQARIQHFMDVTLLGTVRGYEDAA
jgi:excisionase family DNA binding protein